MEDVLKSFFLGIETNLLETLIGLAAVGTLSMTLIEYIKPALRPFFHRRALLKWIGDDYIEPSLAKAISGGGRLTRDLYLLEREDFVSIMRSGLMTALDFPSDYRGSIQQFLGKLSRSSRRLITYLENGGGSEDEKEIKKYMNAKTKISRLIDNRLSLFEKRIEVWWKVYIYALSALFSFAIIYTAYVYVGGSSTQGLGTDFEFETVVFSSAFGALFAPVARDLSKTIARTYRRF